MTPVRKAIIPSTSDIDAQLRSIAQDTTVVIFSGLPGVGKSLFVNEFKRIAIEESKKIDLIQWDVARKAFETDYIFSHYPMGDGTVHDGLKLIAGKWLMQTLKSWIKNNRSTSNILLIEAPLVGHRFVELVHVQKDKELEDFLSSEKTKVLVPIPTKKVREKIEEARAKQVSENAVVWSGAKPSVMLMLWKMTCEIANEFGMDIDLSEQPPYSDGVYEYVYSVILKNRHFEPLIVEEIFEVPEQDEEALHDTKSIQPSMAEANAIGREIIENFTVQQIEEIVRKWYLT